MMRALALLLLMALPATAECVTPENLAKGVTFTREDGSAGVVRVDGKRFKINYEEVTRTARRDERQSEFGIYDLEVWWDRILGPNEPAVTDGPSGFYSFAFATKPPRPQAASNWETTITRLGDSYPGFLAISRRERKSYRVSYRYLTESTAKLSGCTYRILPVEATFTNEDTDLTRRFIYFPDLGFGLETRVIDRKGEGSRELGLTALTPKG